MKHIFYCNGREYDVEVIRLEQGLRLLVDDKVYEVALRESADDFSRAHIREKDAKQGKSVEFAYERQDNEFLVWLDGVVYKVQVRDAFRQARGRVGVKSPARRNRIEVSAPIPGLITQVHVTEGEVVHKDKPLFSLDAMKLENEILAPHGGTIRAVSVKAGSAVEKGQSLAVIVS